MLLLSLLRRFPKSFIFNLTLVRPAAFQAMSSLAKENPFSLFFGTPFFGTPCFLFLFFRSPAKVGSLKCNLEPNCCAYPHACTHRFRFQILRRTRSNAGRTSARSINHFGNLLQRERLSCRCSLPAAPAQPNEGSLGAPLRTYNMVRNIDIDRAGFCVTASLPASDGAQDVPKWRLHSFGLEGVRRHNSLSAGNALWHRRLCA